MSPSARNEFDLIRRLGGQLGAAPPGVIGIGDDAAGVPDAAGWLLYTCDVAVEGRHFRLDRTAPHDVGWRIASANVSDIVACGGSPRHALVSLGVPASVADAQLEALYGGLAEAAHDFGFHVIGGNVSAASELFVDLFMAGHTPRFVARGGARPGDVLAVSGPLGGSRAGLELLERGAATDAERRLIQRHLRPRARIEFAPALARFASAAIDISDGLSSESHHMARASGAALHLSSARIPLPPALREFARAGSQDAIALALNSGEEYELLFTCTRSDWEPFAALGATLIGDVRAGEGVYLDDQPLAAQGWDHLAGRQVLP